MGITLVTTTRCRSLCFSLLEKFIANQTVQPDQWLVVNDGQEPYTYNHSAIEVWNRDWQEDWKKEEPSICLNWLDAIPLIKHDKVIVTDDDDYYSKDYIAKISSILDDVAMGGISRDAYYQLNNKHYKWMGNCGHASLACTGFRSEVLPHIERIIKTWKSVYIDMHLWAEYGTDLFPGTKKLWMQAHTGKKIHVGLKNMPGAYGLGMGHGKPDGWNLDHPDMRILRDWCDSESFQMYKDISRVYFTKPVAPAKKR